MKLVIVESPAKAKTIEKYLGKGYTVKSSKGHIADLPKSNLGVDVEHDFKPEYQVTKPAVLKELKQYLKHADSLVLAVDPDREGEAIGWHVARELGILDNSGRHKSKAKPVERIVFTEITESAVQEAAAHPRNLDMNLVDAQQARRVLDRLVGYKLSPLLWKKIRYGLSAGRVQSVAVRLIVERERLRQAFKADEYWNIVAKLAPKKADKVKVEYKLKEQEGEEEVVDENDKSDHPDFSLVKHKGKEIGLTKQTDAEKVLKAALDEKWIVADVTNKEVGRQPYPPYSTSLLQQDAANRLNFAAKRTMQVAQKLYEAGHITYMRTDSLHISGQAIAAVRKFITGEFGEKYLPAKPIFYKTRAKVAQEAHEAVRPTNFAKKAAALKLAGDEARLYDLIWRRAVASQMMGARFDQQKVTVDSGEYTWQATARRTLFPGFLALYPDRSQDVELPKLTAGQELFPHEVLADQHFTQPPARFSEATLVKELESLGIGRPSTYAPIIQTILTRKYVEKLGKYFQPTDTGMVVTDLLVKHFSDIVDVGFTAGMEDELDQVANGELDWVKMMGKFYHPFEKQLKTKEKQINREDFTVLGKSDEKCPECGKPMIIKLGKYGRFLSCTDFPNCKGMLSIEGEDGGNGVDLDMYQAAPKTDDGRDFLQKQGRFGAFWAHPDYPKVKETQPLELKPEKLKELYGEPPVTDDKRPYLLKQGRFGPFWAHPDYPKVKDIVSIKKTKKFGRKFTKKKPKSN